MSITKELWLAIILVLAIAVAGCVTIYGVTTRQYVEEQLYAKNIDNANMLALTLSTLEKSPDTLDLFIMSQFDIGHYAAITLLTSEGKLISDYSQDTLLFGEAPRWFKWFFEPKVEAGIAQVNDGWNLYGEVRVASDTSFAVDAMWHATTRLIFGLLVVAGVAGVLGGWFLKLILRPLEGVVEQAEAIGNMQFKTLREPKTLELRRVVSAMNKLVLKSKKIMEEENERLDLLRYKTQFDDETGLPNRDYFLSILKGQLAFRDTEGVNCIYLVTFSSSHLVEESEQRRCAVASFISSIEEVLTSLHHHYSDCRTGRISRDQIAVILTEIHAPDVIAMAIDSLCASAGDGEDGLDARQVVTRLRGEDTIESVLSRLNKLILRAENANTHHFMADRELVEHLGREDEAWWSNALNDVIDNQRVETFNFPVLDQNREMVHYQSWPGIYLAGEWRKSGYYTHWARYLGLLARIELTTILHLIDYINTRNSASVFAFLCSEQFITDKSESRLLYDALSTNPRAASQLCFEVRESTAARQPDAFADFCMNLKKRGCGVGIKRVGESFSQLSSVQELGLDYVKIDSAFMSDIDCHSANHAFIRGFCALAHNLGMKVYADGVNRTDYQALFNELGIDGVVSHLEVIEHLLDG